MEPGSTAPRPAVSVVEWAEAVMSGGVLMLLQERRESTPAWAYLNLLAHGDLATLERVRDYNRDRQPLSVWGAVVWGLIVDLLDRATDPRRLVALQRAALVPLELAVWAGEASIALPQDLDYLVQGALEAHLAG
jgi:hypothetical protein